MRLTQVLRSLAKMPLFAGTAVLTLAIGIGATTAIFSVLQGVLLKPLPYSRPTELVVIDHAAPGINMPRAGAAPFLYFTYREEGRVFQDIGLWNTRTTSATGHGRPEEVRTLFVTDNVLAILGIPPAIGRLFSRTDGAPGAPETVVLTYGFWRSRFGGRSAAIGRTLLLDGRPREIIGVLPATFRFLDRDVSVAVPFQFDRNRVALGQLGFGAIARLKPGATIDDATADVARMIPMSLTRFPPFPGGTVRMFEEARLVPNIRSLKEDLVGDVRPYLWVLMGAIGLMLLIACANVANLLLVRAESRRHELAIRTALGAGSMQLARELVMETLTLALLGGLVGLGLAFGALRLLVALAPGNLPRLHDIALDIPVLLFTLALSLIAGLLFGAVLVLEYAARPPLPALRAGGRTAGAGRDEQRVRDALVVAQVALALVLLVSSGLMVRTFQALVDVHPGFTRPDQVQTARLTIPGTQVTEGAAVARMHQAIAAKMAAVPGVTSVALTSSVPMSGQRWHDPLYVQDRAYAQSEVPAIRSFKFVSPGYPKTVGGSLVAGRDFTWTDLHDMRPVAMVSENLARELWGDPAAAIGKRVRPYPTGPWRDVVGVVGDIRDEGVNQEAPPVVYWPLLMADFSPSPDARRFVQRSLSYVIRSNRTGSSGFIQDLGQAVWSINSDLPVADVRSLQEIYDASLARISFTLVMLASGGAMALLLGVAGVYGVIAYAVAQRRREIGIRIALGAQARSVVRLFVARGMMRAGLGVAIGLTVASVATRQMSSLLFQVSSVDPWTYGVVSLLLMAATAFACYVPARRATAVNPTEALRRP